MTAQTATGVLFGSGAFFSYILNKHYLPGVADTVITPNVMLERLPRDSTRVEGKAVVFPTHIGRNEGVGAIGEGGQLPDPGSQEYNQFEFYIRHIYGRVKFDGITLDASKSDVASWLRVIDSEMKNLGKDLSRDRQRVVHNDGSGRLCENDGAIAAAATTFTAKANSDIQGDLTDFSPVRWIRPNMTIAWIEAPTTAPVVQHSAKVVSVNRTTNVVTFTPAVPGGVTIADSSWVVRASNTALTQGANTDLNSTAFAKEPMGVAGIVDDANPPQLALGSATAFQTGFQNVDATLAVNDWNRAQMFLNGGTPRAITDNLMDQAWTGAVEIGDVSPSAIYGSFGMVRAYSETTVTQRRFNDTTVRKGGTSYLDFNDTMIIADRDCYNNRFYFLDETDLKVYVMSEPQWMDMDGSVYQRMLDHDAYQASIYCRDTLGSDVRDHHVLLGDLIEA